MGSSSPYGPKGLIYSAIIFTYKPVVNTKGNGSIAHIQTYRGKVICREENSPEVKLRSLMS